ncbi:MAG: endonuclease domain-containing protein [Bacteroidota bacterium]
MTFNRGKTRSGIIAAKTLGRELRKNQTTPEALLWRVVRNRKFKDLKFYRQHPIFFEFIGKQKFFIADFYCNEKNLVIEIDGKIHERQKEYDQFRDFILDALGVTVLRIKNEEIENDLKDVLRKITDVVTRPKSLSCQEMDFTLPSLRKRRGSGMSSET